MFSFRVLINHIMLTNWPGTPALPCHFSFTIRMKQIGQRHQTLNCNNWKLPEFAEWKEQHEVRLTDNPLIFLCKHQTPFAAFQTMKRFTPSKWTQVNGGYPLAAYQHLPRVKGSVKPDSTDQGWSGWEQNVGGKKASQWARTQTPGDLGYFQSWLSSQRRSLVWSSPLSSADFEVSISGRDEIFPKPSLKLLELCSRGFSFRVGLDFHSSHKFPLLRFPRFGKMRKGMVTTASNT